MTGIRGFSLLEFLTVFGIIAILSIVGFSGFTFFRQKSESDVALSELVNAIQLTRAEAISRQEKVILCGSINQRDCASDWDQGYLIKTTHHIIYHFEAHVTNQQLHWRSFPNHKPLLEFLPKGLSPFQNGTFWFCAAGAKRPGFAVALNKKATRLRIAYPDKDGILRDDKGIAFQCRT